MDPNANIAEQERIRSIPVAQRTTDDKDRLHELGQALFGWIRNGGFQPTNWADCPLTRRAWMR